MAIFDSFAKNVISLLFRKTIKNGHFSPKSKGGTKGKFSKMADFLVELPKAKKIGNTSRLIA